VASTAEVAATKATTVNGGMTATSAATKAATSAVNAARQCIGGREG
jgi:hypothetical protein